MELTHGIRQALDRGIASQVDVIYTDFQKAFDEVDHEILLRKLDSLGYSEALLELFKSYLKDRRQYVVYKGKSSDFFGCPSGVPQGSNLGPYLFMLYISDIHSAINNSSCLLYADDLKLYREIKDERDQHLLQKDLDQIAEWSDMNKLPLNINKCGKMTFTHKSKTHLIMTEYNIKQIKLKSYEKVKDLGVILDSKLYFKEQIQLTRSKANKNMGIIMRHSRFFRNADTIRMLYLTLVGSILDFASVVCSPLGKGNSKNLERTQKRFLKFLYFKNFEYYESEIKYSELLLGYELVTLEIKRDMAALLFLRDIVNSQVDSAYLLEKVNFFAPTRIGRIRNSLFSTPPSRTTHFEATPIHYAQLLFGKLERIDSAIDIFFNSRITFKHKVQEALLKLYQNVTVT